MRERNFRESLLCSSSKLLYNTCSTVIPGGNDAIGGETETYVTHNPTDHRHDHFLCIWLSTRLATRGHFAGRRYTERCISQSEGRVSSSLALVRGASFPRAVPGEQGRKGETSNPSQFS